MVIDTTGQHAVTADTPLSNGSTSPSKLAREAMETKLERLRQKVATSDPDEGRRFLAVSEVQKHCTYDDCWVIINKNVYDVTKFADRHPGGYDLLLKCGGRDVTEVFHQYHPSAVYDRLIGFHVGEIVNYEPADVVTAISALGDQLEKQGFFVPKISFTVKTTLWCLSLLSTGVACILMGRKWNSSALQLISALFIAGHFQQIAFLGHDTGHCAVTGIRWIDQWYGLVIGNLLSGISIGWWKDSHNTHHIYTNVIQHDPDIQHLPFLAIDSRFFKSLWSFYHNRQMVFDAFAQKLVSYQHFLFYPIMAFARWNLYFQSLVLMFFKPRVEYRYVEVGFEIIFVVWFSYLLSFCNSFSVAIAVLFLSHGIAGILHVQIVLSHMACETLGQVPYSDDAEQWLDVQLKTSLDVDCYPSSDWFYGGVPFPVGPHLFPRMPRHNLREATKYVIKLCKEYGRDYKRDSFYECNKMVIANLYKVALEARKGRFTRKGDRMIWDGLNANG